MYAPATVATGIETSATHVPIIMSRCGMNPIGDSPIACSRPTKNQTASPAITAVFTPAPNRGRIAAYTHRRPIPDTKSSATHNGTALSIAPGALPSACIAAAMSAFSHTPYVSQSTMFSTTPASSPPSTTRPQLILPIAHLEEGEDPLARRPTLGAERTAAKQT